jgi:tetratricopeptide (TPR) repeat protein
MKNENDTYYESDEFKRLLARYEEMLTTHQSTYMDADELADIAEYYFDLGEDEKADACADYALQLHPGSVDPLVFKARRAMYKGDYSEAKRISDTIDDKTDREVIYLNAELLIRQQHVAEANIYLHQNEHPEDEDYYLFLYDVANIFADNNCTGEALDWVEASLKVAPNYFEAKLLKAEMLADKGDAKEAIHLLDTMLDERPYSIDCWELQSQAYYSDGQFNKAIDACDFALAIDEKDADSIMVKANSYFHLENYEKAHQLYQEYIQLNPTDELAFFFDGVALNSLGRTQEALGQLLKADEVSGGFSEDQEQIYVQLAFTFSYLKFAKRAMTYIDKALKINPEDAELYTIRGFILLGSGEKKKAQECFKVALKYATNYQAIVFKIAVSYYDNRQYATCMKLMNSLLKEDEGSWQRAYPYLAVCHLNMEHIHKYFEYLKLACATDPENAKEVLGEFFPDMDPSEYYTYALKLWNENKK